MMHLLIVEDERILSGEIHRFLEKEGFVCDEAHTGRIASDKIFSNDYDLILLDLGLPDYEGLDLLRESIKNKSTTSVIILSARTAIEDKIKGLDLGADDYLSKPFSMIELKSRILAVTRRKHGLKGNIIHAHGLDVDLDKRKAFYNEHEILLTKKEYDIFSFLLLNKNKVTTRLQISEHIWGDIFEENYNSNYIDVHVKNIRKKLSEYMEGDFLETVRGIGFRFNE
ncbi:MAG: response regulator transcription factor [Prolixibacteraceae bacterium]|jgi:DNA-binding response OmpR family regulator|nr:response regulator transcription factor [Prolixibacteraceae bacterium]